MISCPAIFQVAQDLAQALHPLDIQPSCGVGQSRGADFTVIRIEMTPFGKGIWSHYTTKAPGMKRKKFSLDRSENIVIC